MSFGVDDHVGTEIAIGHYVELLTRLGAIRSEHVRRAFTEVPRHLFVESYYGPSGPVTLPPDGPLPTDVLSYIYEDNSLLTHLPLNQEQDGASSCSRPSLTAEMIEHLDLGEGIRVLEIGCGTGYAAALVSHLTKTEVTTIDVNEAVVNGARRALKRAGCHDVRVIHGDGYLGGQDLGSFDRIVVTVGCSGVSPHWAESLRRGGILVAPLYHGGEYPVFVISKADNLCGWPAILTSFMPAAGMLHSTRSRIMPHLPHTQTSRHPSGMELDQEALDELCFFMGIRDPHFTKVWMDSPSMDHNFNSKALVYPVGGALLIQRDCFVLAGQTEMLKVGQALAEDWNRLGRPRAQEWTCTFNPIGTAESLLMPTDWHLRDNPPESLS